ncbi:MAG: hypothetical protein MI922_08675, partial [Bacteroidales bacterium]|nr:hypothetical protein [Bacteroidales bacterium]
MKTLEILLIVDTERVLTSNTLLDSVEMVTNNKYSEYHNETKNEIHSICFSDELIKWRAVCKVTGKIIEIEGFNGEMINEKV